MEKPRPFISQLRKKGEKLLAGAMLAGTLQGCTNKESLDSAQSSEQASTENTLREGFLPVRVESLPPSLRKQYESQIIEQQSFQREKQAEHHPFYDSNDSEFFTYHEYGEYTKEEREARIEHLSKDVTIFRDIGRTFYFVQPGDGLGIIKQKLSRFPEFAYLKKMKKLEDVVGFNIKNSDLQEGIWLPLPNAKEHRVLSEEQFREYAHFGIERMLLNPQYGSEVEKILKEAGGEQKFLHLLEAVARQESGERLGLFVFQRYEAGDHKTFSYSIYHLLMEDAGLRARKKLGMTEGQLTHPENATQLFLAYLIEKNRRSKTSAGKYCVIEDLEDAEHFAAMYNGRYWKEYNKDYADNILKYYQEAEKKF